MRLTTKVVSMLALTLALIMIPSVLLIWSNQQNNLMMQARTRALTVYQMILVTRQWVAENRDRIKPVPAEATKELSAYAKYMSDFRFHITSDTLMNPENYPDDFEKRAIQSLRQGAKEYSEKGNIEGMGKVFRYAAPLMINQSCMKCHSHQGYIIDDFRGLISVSIPLADMEQVMRADNKLLLTTVLIGFAGIVFIVGFLIYRQVLRPLTTLSVAVGKVHDGEYGVKTGIRTDDELQDLSEAFDMMSNRIAENDNILKNKLEDAVAKYINIVKKLEQTNQQLGSVNKLKTDLLDSIAHEIRTPLTKIMSYSELINDPRLATDTDSKAKFAKLLKKNITSLTGMFNDIITLSRLEHDQYRYHKITVAVLDMVNDILCVMQEEIGAKKLNVLVEISEDAVLLVDAESFKYALSNIISNACKYAHNEGNITIWTEMGDDYLTIACRDEGVGIPPEELEDVFERFHRGSNVKMEFPGTGLGLAIVSRVVNAQNGKAEISSVLGEYTEVRLIMPKSFT